MDPVDLTVLGGVAGGNVRALDELLRDYVRINRPVMQQLELACRAADWRETRRLAHRLAGSSHMVGAKPLAHAVGELELAAQAGDGASATGHLGAALAAFDATCAWIEARPRS
jgi:HPt (histidine-containing phosphotransfer) domain-containing protein